MKRRISVKYFLGLICAMILSFTVMYQNRVDAKSVTLSKWYSDGENVGYWKSNPQVYFSNLSSSINIASHVNTAVNKWKNAGIKSTVITTPSSADIKFYGGTKAQLNSIGFVYTSKTFGHTKWDSSTTVAQAQNSHNIKKITAASASMCSEAKYLDNMAIHEYGHALGWEGHIPEGSEDENKNVMYKNNQDRTTLSKKDINHILQVYNAMR